MNPTVKQLLIERTYAEAAVAQAKSDQSQANEKLRNAQEYRRQIQEQIDLAQNATPERLAVSDRAVLNYIEIRLGFDLNHVRDLMQDDLQKHQLQAVIKDNVVLAVKA